MMRLRWVCSSTLTALGAVALLSAAGCGNESEEYNSYPPWAPGDQELTARDGIERDARPGRDQDGRPSDPNDPCQGPALCADHGPIDCVMDRDCQLEVACVVTSGKDRPMPFATRALALRQQPEQSELLAAAASPERLLELAARLGVAGECKITCASRGSIPQPSPKPTPEPTPVPTPVPAPICEKLDAKTCSLHQECELSPPPLCQVMCIRAPCPPMPCGEPRCMTRKPEPTPPPAPECRSDEDCYPTDWRLFAGTGAAMCAVPTDGSSKVSDEKLGALFGCVPTPQPIPPRHCLKAPGATLGHCVDGPVACPAIWQPVCGSDGRTYGNECEANAAGVRIASKGECAPQPAKKCFVGGCSGQICSERPDVVTTCEWAPAYRCVSLSECGPFGPGGACAWKNSESYTRCVRSANEATVYLY